MNIHTHARAHVRERERESRSRQTTYVYALFYELLRLLRVFLNHFSYIVNASRFKVKIMSSVSLQGGTNTSLSYAFTYANGKAGYK